MVTGPGEMAHTKERYQGTPNIAAHSLTEDVAGDPQFERGDPVADDDSDGVGVTPGAHGTA